MWDPHGITGGNPADPVRGDPLGYLRDIPYHMGPVWFPNTPNPSPSVDVALW